MIRRSLLLPLIVSGVFVGLTLAACGDSSNGAEEVADDDASKDSGKADDDDSDGADSRPPHAFTRGAGRAGSAPQ